MTTSRELASTQTRSSSRGSLLIAFHDWTFLLGPQFCAGFGNGLLLGYLMYKSALVPPRAALVGLIGGPLAFFGGVLALFGVLDQPSPGLFLLTIPEIAWEAFLAIYLTWKGFRPSPVLAGYGQARIVAVEQVPMPPHPKRGETFG